MEENNQQSSMNKPCRLNCGFYGSQNYEGLCSKCHRTKLEKQNQLKLQSAKTPIVQSPEKCLPAINSLKISDSSEPVKELPPVVEKAQTTADKVATPDEDKLPSATTQKDSQEADKPSSNPGDSEAKKEEPVPTQKKRSNLCAQCNKKIGLTALECYCGKRFCPLHRYSDAHNCPFDYKQKGQQEIRQALPQILSKKLENI